MLILPSFELFEDISAPSFQCQIYDLLLRIMSEASIPVSNLVGQLLTLLDYRVWIYNYLLTFDSGDFSRCTPQTSQMDQLD